MTESTTGNNAKSPPSAAEIRAIKREKALRENLQRRKDQQRGRISEPEDAGSA